MGQQGFLVDLGVEGVVGQQSCKFSVQQRSQTVIANFVGQAIAVVSFEFHVGLVGQTIVVQEVTVANTGVGTESEPESG